MPKPDFGSDHPSNKNKDKNKDKGHKGGKKSFDSWVKKGFTRLDVASGETVSEIIALNHDTQALSVFGQVFSTDTGKKLVGHQRPRFRVEDNFDGSFISFTTPLQTNITMLYKIVERDADDEDDDDTDNPPPPPPPPPPPVPSA